MKLSGIFFCLVILAFLMPFVVVKCSDTKVASVSGLKMVTGGKIKTDLVDDMAKGMNNLAGDLADDAGQTGDLLDKEDMEEAAKPKDTDRMPPKFCAILAFLAALIGLLYCFICKKKIYLVPLILALIGFISLIFLSVSVKSGLKEMMGGNEFAGMIKMNMQFGYYLALFSFLIAGVLAFLGKGKNVLTREQISQAIPDSVEKAFDKARDTVTAAGADLKDKLGDTVDKVKDTIEEAKIGEKIEGAIDKVKDKIEDSKIGEKIDNVIDKAKDIIDPDQDKAP